MSDLIKREDAIRELERSSVYMWSVEEDQLAHNWAISIIESLPPADAEWIPREHFSVKGKTTQFGFCGYRHAGTDETDYCSRAVRRKK